MKRIVAFILVYTILLCSCGREDLGTSVLDAGSGSAVDSTATDSAVSGSTAKAKEKKEKSDKKSKLNITMAKKNGPMLSKKADTTKKGVGMYQFSMFSTGMTKGDDGNIYYFRCQGEEKNKKIIFYKNSGVKVCEALIPAKKYFHITSFAKYGRYFGIVYNDENADEYFMPLQIKDGKWGKAVGLHPDSWEGVFYEDAFYCFYDDYSSGDGRMQIIDINGNTRRITYEKGSGDDDFVEMQTIVDDKIYYYVEKTAEQGKVMRCNLDGSGKEELFRFSEPWYGNCSKLTLDEKYLYIPMLRKGNGVPETNILIRIPLYGGAILEYKSNTWDWYDMSGDSIYYMDETGNICRIGKDLAGEPETVTTVSVNVDYGEIPFLYADGHLMVEVCNDEEIKKIDAIRDHTVLIMDDEIGMEYANEYHWIAEDGRVEETIPGTGLNERYKKLYEIAKDLRGSQFIPDKYYM